MRARVETVKLTDEIKTLSDEIDSLEQEFKIEKKACFEEVFVKYNEKNGIEDSQENVTRIKAIEDIQKNIENNMNYLIKKQILLNQIYMAKSKARMSDLNHVIVMQKEAKNILLTIKESIADELTEIRTKRRKL